MVDTTAAAQTATDDARYESPTLQRLSDSLRDGRPGALDDFWRRIEGGAPLFEPIEGDDQFRWITFLWRGDVGTRDVSVGLGDIPTPDRRKWTFRRLGDTDLWFKTDRVPRDARFAYLLRINGGPLVPDPLNARGFGGRSVAESPDAPAQPWAQERADIPRGRLVQDCIHSEVLNEDRPIGVYTPPGYGTGGAGHRLLIVFDGETYGNATAALIPTPRILDNLLAAERVPPTVAVLVNNMSQQARDRDLRCSAPFARFLARELVPWLRTRYHLSARSSDVILAGSSDGGLLALCAAHEYPDVFGNVLSQSANVFYAPRSPPSLNVYTRDSGWLTRKFVTSPRLPLRFYLEVGLLEAGLVNPVAEHRRLRDVLEAKGYPVTYSEFSGGHDYLSWRNSLGDGLIALLGGDRGSQDSRMTGEINAGPRP
jgi:enterochelin esterase family protein